MSQKQDTENYKNPYSAVAKGKGSGKGQTASVQILALLPPSYVIMGRFLNTEPQFLNL